MGWDQNFGLGSKFLVGIEILGREQNFGSGALGLKSWVGIKILGWDQNFGAGLKFWVGSKI